MNYVIEKRKILQDKRKLIYRKVIGKSGKIWVYPINVENKAEMVHCRKPGDYMSRGYGGSTISFPLEDGSELKLQGPWHSNSDTFYNDTGIDIRDTYYTFVVISKGLKHEGFYKTIMEDIIYMDEKPTLGPFHRGDELAIKIFKELGQPIYLYSESSGGSSCGIVDQKTVDNPWWKK